MENELLKQEMMGLWKETFGDSSQYVSLVFDNYFHPDRVAYREEDGRLLSAMVGVDYSFVSQGGKNLRGLYLCGLATRPEARRKGIMTSLLKEMNLKAEAMGYDFTFLIPEKDSVRKFYADRGFNNAFFKKKEHYVRAHKFADKVEGNLNIFEKEDVDKLIVFLQKNGNLPYNNLNSVSLVHSEIDWRIVLHECLISEDKIVFLEQNGEVVSVAFFNEFASEITIKKIISRSTEEALMLLEKISKKFIEKNITVIRDLEEVVEQSGGSQLWSPFYAQTNGAKAEYENVAVVEEPYNRSLDAEPFGMIHIPDIRKLLAKLGEPLIREEGYSDEELKEIVLRKPVGKMSDALEKILDLPLLSFSMSLLLE